MPLKAPDSNRRAGSNMLALIMGVVLLAFAGFVLIEGRNPLENVPYHVVVGSSSLVFGLVLLVWVVSDWKKWIGNETVNMVVGVVAAVITISAFAQQIDKTSNAKATVDATTGTSRSAPGN